MRGCFLVRLLPPLGPVIIFAVRGRRGVFVLVFGCKGGTGLVDVAGRLGPGNSELGFFFFHRLFGLTIPSNNCFDGSRLNGEGRGKSLTHSQLTGGGLTEEGGGADGGGGAGGRGNLGESGCKIFDSRGVVHAVFCCLTGIVTFCDVTAAAGGGA